LVRAGRGDLPGLRDGGAGIGRELDVGRLGLRPGFSQIVAGDDARAQKGLVVLASRRRLRGSKATAGTLVPARNGPLSSADSSSRNRPFEVPIKSKTCDRTGTRAPPQE